MYQAFCNVKCVLFSFTDDLYPKHTKLQIIKLNSIHKINELRWFTNAFPTVHRICCGWAYPQIL